MDNGCGEVHIEWLGWILVADELFGFGVDQVGKVAVVGIVSQDAKSIFSDLTAYQWNRDNPTFSIVPPVGGATGEAIRVVETSGICRLIDLFSCR